MKITRTVALTASALLLAACGSSGSGSEPSATATAPLGPDRWMEDVYGSKPDTTLGAMVIPGTHDSGSYGIDVDSPCDLTKAAGTADVIGLLAQKNPCAAAGMYRAQDQDLAAQLAAGIRYLDLRVSVPAGDAAGASPAAASGSASASAGGVPFVLEHEFVSTPLTSALDQILQFAASHPKEQVILDIQHVDLAKDADTAYYYAELQKVLANYAPDGAKPVCAQAWDAAALGVTPAELSSKVTLGQAWEAKRNLVVLVPDGTLPADSCYSPRSTAILSQWPNTEDPAKSVEYNEVELGERAKRLANPSTCSNNQANVTQGDNWCGFFVNQMQLTFQPATFAGCIGETTDSCSLFAYSQKVNPATPGLIEQWRVGEGLPVNIVIVDYFDDSAPANYTETLIGINRTLANGGASASASASAS